MKYNRLIYIIAAALSLSACTKEIPFNGDYSGEKLVLYSCAVPGRPLTADVFKSKFILSRTDETVRDPLAGATVKVIVDGGKTYDFKEVTEYIDYGYGYGRTDITYVSEYIPKEGDHFTVTAYKPGFPAVKGEATVPAAPDFTVERVEIRNEEKHESFGYANGDLHFIIKLNDPADVRNYYRMEIMHEYEYTSPEEEEEGIEGSTYVEQMRLESNDVIFMNTSSNELFDAIGMEQDTRVPECFEDAAFNGKNYTLDVFSYFYWHIGNDEDLDLPPYYDGFGFTKAGGLHNGEPAFHYSDFEVTLYNITEDMFLYMRSVDAYENAEDFGGMLSELTSIHNNVEDGIGCVCAMTGRTVRPKDE